MSLDKMMVVSVQKRLPESLDSSAKDLFLEPLKQIRDTTPASSRTTSKGALIEETYAVFHAVSQGLPLSDIRTSILKAEVIQKTAYTTRRKIWDAIRHRYLFACSSSVGLALANATQQGIHSTEYLSLAYLYFTLRDRLVFDFVTGPVWDKWQRQTTAISREDVLYFLQTQAEEFP